MARNGNVVFRLSTRLALLVILLGHASVASAYDCNVHLRRTNIYATATDANPIPASLSFRDICFDVTSAEDTTLGEWPICQCINQPNRIVSNKNDANCPAGHLEIGRCIKSKRYYTKDETAPDATPGNKPDFEAKVFRAFVPNSAVCEPCAHDAVSAVLGCKALCRRYFNERFFMDGNAMNHPPGNQSQHDGGSWVIENPDPMISPPDNPNGVPLLSEFRVCDVNAPEEYDHLATELESGLQVCQEMTQEQRANEGVPTTTEICERRCGPPNFHNTEEQTVWDHDGDNWWSINFQHREPNEHLDDWLRSYNNVPDRPDPPAKECEMLVDEYCDYLAEPDATPENPFAAPYIDGIHKAACKKNIVIRSRLALERGSADPAPFVDYGPAMYIPGPVPPEEDGAIRTGDTFDFSDVNVNDPFAIPTEFAMKNDGFCDHFRRENNLCPQTCYEPEGHGATNPLHICDNSAAGLLQPNPNQTASCIDPAVSNDTAREGGAVCSIPPPQAGEDDFHDKTPYVDYNKVALIAPPRPTNCGDPRIATSGATTHAVTYDPPNSPSPGGTDADAIRNEIAKATWRNLSQPDPVLASGGFTYVAPFFVWQTDKPVQLVPGLNRIVYTFTDRHLRTSGEAIDMLWSPTTTTTLP